MSIQFVNLNKVHQEAIHNLDLHKEGPPNPTSLAKLKADLLKAKDKLPPTYRSAIYSPFLDFVQQLSDQDFQKISSEESQATFVFDIAQAILQHSNHYLPDATSAFQEVVSDLYDGFLSGEDRHNIKLPDHSIIPPIVKWGNPESGPYTMPSDSTAQLKIKCAVVNLPPSLATGVLIAWASLAHETAGHDISHADNGLLEEMSHAVRLAIRADKQIKSDVKSELAKYWSNRIDETSADIMGILNMGPAAAIGTIPFFRAFLLKAGLPPKLRSYGPAGDEHPADILRVLLGAAAVSHLSFTSAADWSSAILDEGLKDLTTIYLDGDGSPTNGKKIDLASAKRAAEIVASTLIQTPFVSLQHHALQEIQDWANTDENIVEKIRVVLKHPMPFLSNLPEGSYATHVVAATIYEALFVQQEIAPLFTNMISLLKQLHDKNPSWGPLFMLLPGDLRKDVLIQLPILPQ